MDVISFSLPSVSMARHIDVCLPKYSMGYMLKNSTLVLMEVILFTFKTINTTEDKPNHFLLKMYPL